MEMEIQLEKRIPEDLAGEVVKKSVYCSTHLRNLEVLPSCDRLRITVDDEQAGAVREKVVRFVSDMLQGHRPIKRKVVFENQVVPEYVGNAWEEMVRREWVWPMGMGQVGLRGPALGLYRYFDTVFTGMGKQQFAAEECQFPTLIPSPVLGRCQYFSSFPQSITFVTHLVEELDLLEEFVGANQQGPLRFPRREALIEPHHCLSPAVCYHCYRTLENQDIPAERPRIFTAVGACFRYESRNTTSLERLWNFNMREIVFVGTRQAVNQCRRESIARVGEWLNRIGLRACFETASDPFFTNNFSEKTFFQLLGDLKYEMRLNVSAERTIAAGSFNIHNDFFGKAFSIRTGAAPASTGCTAFGLERWVYAFVCQKGFDLSTWPAEVRRFVEGQA